jgi:hypothetical protein
MPIVAPFSELEWNRNFALLETKKPQTINFRMLAPVGKKSNRGMG